MASIKKAKPNPDHFSPLTKDIMPPNPITVDRAMPTAAKY